MLPPAPTCRLPPARLPAQADPRRAGLLRMPGQSRQRDSRSSGCMPQVSALPARTASYHPAQHRGRRRGPSPNARPGERRPELHDLRASGTMIREQLLPRIFGRMSAAFLATEVVSRCVTYRTAQGMRVRLGLYPHSVSPRPAALGKTALTRLQQSDARGRLAHACSGHQCLDGGSPPLVAPATLKWPGLSTTWPPKARFMIIKTVN
jgi:hypothetical protein